ncbi:hypothetical protein ACFQ51_36930 [Streptomyces kaempferi]
MGVLITVLAVAAAAGLVLLALSLRNVQQYEKGVVCRRGRVRTSITPHGIWRVDPDRPPCTASRVLRGPRGKKG